MDKHKNSFKIKEMILQKQLNSLMNLKANPNDIILNSVAFQSQIVKENPFLNKANKIKLNNIKNNNTQNSRSNSHASRISNNEIINKTRSRSKEHYSNLSNNLSNLTNNNIRNNINNNKGSKNAKHESDTLLLPNIFTKNFIKDDTDSKEIYKQNKEFYKNLSLAEKIGLVNISNKPLSKQDWEILEKKVSNRIDHTSSCPICLERLSTQNSILLSCSHVFHKPCLTSFENLSKTNSCPVCRGKNYQKRSYFNDKEKMINYSIKLIQSNYRGFNLRFVLYKTIFQVNTPSSKLLKKRYSYFRIRELFSRINEKIKINSKINSSLLNEMQDQIEAQKKLNKKLENDINNNKYIKKQLDDNNASDSGFVNNIKNDKNNNLYWNKLIEKYNIKKKDNCSICLNPFNNKNVYLLDCGHMYHENCILSLEKYDIYYNKRCPACRKEEYSKKLMKLSE